MPLQTTIGQAKAEIAPSLIAPGPRWFEPAGRQAHLDRRGAQLDRVRRPPGAGGEA